MSQLISQAYQPSQSTKPINWTKWTDQPCRSIDPICESISLAADQCLFIAEISSTQESGHLVQFLVANSKQKLLCFSCCLGCKSNNFWYLGWIEVGHCRGINHTQLGSLSLYLLDEPYAPYTRDLQAQVACALRFFLYRLTHWYDFYYNKNKKF